MNDGGTYKGNIVTRYLADTSGLQGSGVTPLTFMGRDQTTPETASSSLPKIDRVRGGGARMDSAVG